jgi:hypothetical protein
LVRTPDAARGTWARQSVERYAEAGYANGGVPPGTQPGIGGLAAGIGGVDGGDVDDVVSPRAGGEAGVVGVVVIPAPPIGGAEADEEVDVADAVSLLVVDADVVPLLVVDADVVSLLVVDLGDG